MATPINDNQENREERKEPREKGGVAGTDSKDFNYGDPLKKDSGPQKDQTTNQKTS